MILFRYLILYVYVLFLFTSCTEKNSTLYANDNKIINDLNSSSNHAVELNKKITSTQLDIKADLSRIDNSINNYLLQLENLFNKYNKGSSVDNKKLSIVLNELTKNREDFRDFQKQLFLVLTQLSRDSISKSEKFTAIIDSSKQNCQSSNTIIGCNSDIKILKEYLEILLKKEQNISTTKDDAIDYFTKSITHSKDRFEYYVYIIGLVLVLIGFLIFVVVVTLGLWQKNKVRSYGKKIRRFENNHKSFEDKTNNNLKLYEDSYKKYDLKIESTLSTLTDKESDLELLNERINDLENNILDCCIKEEYLFTKIITRLEKDYILTKKVPENSEGSKKKTVPNDSEDKKVLSEKQDFKIYKVNNDGDPF